MALDPSIILSGQQFNLGGAMRDGLGLAAAQKQFNTQNALAELYKTRGADILAGDKTAINALAGFDPALAMDVQTQHQTNAYAAEDQQMARDRAKRETEEALRAQKDALTAEQLAAAAAKHKASLDALSTARTPQEWDQIAAQTGEADMVGKFGSRDALLAEGLGASEAMENELKRLELEAARNPPPPDPLSPEGKFARDKATGLLPADAQPTPGQTINLGGGSDKQIFDTVAASNERAATALVGLNGLAEAAAALDAGAITGFAADQRLYLAKLGAYLGMTDPAAVENTETFRAAIAPQVSAMIKATVGSANISNADREFAEKAAAGSIQLDEASIKRMIRIMTKMGKEAIRLHNEKVNKVYPEGGQFERERSLFLLPEASAATVEPTSSPGANKTSTGVEWSISE